MEGGGAYAQPAHCCGCITGGSENTWSVLPLPATPWFPTGLTTAAVPSNWPQYGRRIAGEKENQMEGVLQGGGPQSCGRWELAWMEPVYVQTCRAVLCHQL